MLVDEYVHWFFDTEIIEGAKRMLPESDSNDEGKQFSRIAYYYSILREKYIDDWIVSCIRSGCRQLLLLGAGYDTRFLRLTVIKDYSVDTYEVDLPQTIADKMAILRNHLSPFPKGLHLVPLDLNRESISKMIDYGFNPSLRTAYVWQGVSYYLPERTVTDVLDSIFLSMSVESTLAFDCCSPLMTYQNDKIPGIRFHLERLKKINEPYLFGMEAGEMRRLLEQKGFKDIDIQTQTELEYSITRVKTLPENMWYVATAAK